MTKERTMLSHSQYALRNVNCAGQQQQQLVPIYSSSWRPRPDSDIFLPLQRYTPRAPIMYAPVEEPGEYQASSKPHRMTKHMLLVKEDEFPGLVAVQRDEILRRRIFGGQSEGTFIYCPHPETCICKVNKRRKLYDHFTLLTLGGTDVDEARRGWRKVRAAKEEGLREFMRAVDRGDPGIDENTLGVFELQYFRQKQEERLQHLKLDAGISVEPDNDAGIFDNANNNAGSSDGTNDVPIFPSTNKNAVIHECNPDTDQRQRVASASSLPEPSARQTTVSRAERSRNRRNRSRRGSAIEGGSTVTELRSMNRRDSFRQPRVQNSNEMAYGVTTVDPMSHTRSRERQQVYHNSNLPKVAGNGVRPTSDKPNTNENCAEPTASRPKILPPPIEARSIGTKTGSGKAPTTNWSNSTYNGPKGCLLGSKRTRKAYEPHPRIPFPTVEEETNIEEVPSSTVDNVKLLRMKWDEKRENLLGIQSDAPYKDPHYLYEDALNNTENTDPFAQFRALVVAPSENTSFTMSFNPAAADAPIPISPPSNIKPEAVEEARRARQKRDEEREDLLGIQSLPYRDREYAYEY